MNRRLTVAVAATAALGLSAGVATTSGAAIKKNEIRMVGGLVVEPGSFVKDSQHFKRRTTRVEKGALVTLVNRTKTQDPHTITFVRKRFLPKQFESGLEEQIFTAHGVDPNNEDAPPANLVVDNGQPVPEDGTMAADTMFSRSVMGDSAFIAPGQDEFKFRVTANRDSRLFFYCGIHPWMQGKIVVE